MRPPKGRRWVVHTTVTMLFLVITVGTFLAVSPVGNDGRGGFNPFRPVISLWQSNGEGGSTSLIAQRDGCETCSPKNAPPAGSTSGDAITYGQLVFGISPGYGFEAPFMNMNNSQQLAVINQMKSDGVQWLRLDYWVTDTFDYQFIKDAEAAGINVEVIFEHITATDTQFASLAAQAVATLKPLGVHTYEILNEANLSQFTLTADQYTWLLKVVYPAIKAADPSATVLMTGMNMSGNPRGFLQGIYNAGGKGYFDAVSMHPYSSPNCPDSGTFCTDLPALYTIMQQNGDGNKKIWITEFGCSTGTDAGQSANCTDTTLAQRITPAYNQANSWGWVGALFIFNWQDNTHDGDFGLYYADGSPKTAALSAFEQIGLKVAKLTKRVG
jgi:polysaccharide biosynthesis protein PslG